MRKIWVRVLVSLLAGGALAETARIMTGKEINSLVFIGAILTFILISVVFGLMDIQKMKSKNDKSGEIFREDSK